MQGGVEAQGQGQRRLIHRLPGIEQGVGRVQTEALRDDLRPLPVTQGSTDVAHMAEADARSLGQLGDAPGETGIAEKDAQHPCRLWGEDRLQLPAFHRWLFGYGT